jgi:hypothetical protein
MSLDDGMLGLFVPLPGKKKTQQKAPGRVLFPLEGNGARKPSGFICQDSLPISDRLEPGCFLK